MTGSSPESHQKRRRRAPLLWGSGALAAAIIVLGVNGTLSSWTTAIIHNDNNTARAATAVALSESLQGATTPCQDTSTITDGSNTATCTTINKYGSAGNQATSAMSPDDSNTTDVTFENTGNGSAATFTLTPGTCTDNAAATGVLAGSLCSSGDLTVAVSCSDGGSYTAANAYTDLTWAAAAPGSQAAVTHTATIAAGAQITCRFTTTLLSSAPTTDASMSISQPLTWTLSV